MKFPKGLLLAGLFLVGVPAAAFYGGGGGSGWYFGSMPSNWFTGEPCFTSTIETDVRNGIREVRVNPAGVLNDGNPNTFLRCQDFANQNRLVCAAGFPDGTVVSCGDDFGPKRGPGPSDKVYIVLDTTNPASCDVVIESAYGEANPACRGTVGTGGTSGTGGTTSTGGTATGGTGGTNATCNATNAQAVLSTGQSTTIASNACVQLKVDPTWSTVDPLIQALPGTSTYPVPFSVSSCKGTQTQSFTGDWSQNWLVDGQGAAANIGCDIFVKLQGDGSTVKFTYYD